MRTPSGRTLLLPLSLLLSCAAPADAPVDVTREVSGPPHVEAYFVAKIRPRLGTMTFERVDARGEPILQEPLLQGKEGEPGIRAQDFTDLPIIADEVAGSGPAYSVELVTNSVGFNGSCPAGFQSNTFCGNVTFRHFTGMRLSDVFVQVTAVTATVGGASLPDHGGVNNDASYHGLDNSLGLWRHTSSGAPNAGIVDAPPSNAGTRDWVFNNPDNADTNIYLRAVASLYPTLWFNSNFTIDQSAPILAGQPMIVHYEYARNTNCQGSGATVSGFFLGPFTHNHSVTFPRAGQSAFDVHVTAPFGNDIKFWFRTNDGTGCEAYDSNFGNDYHFVPQNPNPVLHFLPDYSESVTGVLVGGGTVSIDYDLTRLPPYNGIDAYDRVTSGGTTTVFYRFDGGSVSQASLTGLPYGVPGTINGASGQMQVTPVLSIPSGVHDLEMWFNSNDGNGNNRWDSNMGSNYHFAVN